MTSCLTTDAKEKKVGIPAVILAGDEKYPGGGGARSAGPVATMYTYSYTQMYLGITLIGVSDDVKEKNVYIFLLSRISQHEY